MAVNFGFEICTLEANVEKTKWMLVDIEDIIGHFNKSKPIIAQEAGKNVMIYSCIKEQKNYLWKL